MQILVPMNHNVIPGNVVHEWDSAYPMQPLENNIYF